MGDARVGEQTGHVRIGCVERNALPSESVEARGLRKRLTKGAGITPSEIISKEDDDDCRSGVMPRRL